MAEKKKILYLITKSNFGGAGRYVYDLAIGINKDEFEPVVAFGLPAQAGGKGKLKTMLEEKNIRTISIPSLERDMNILKEFLVFLSLLKIINKENPDVLHLNSPKAGGLGSFAGRLVGIKNIIYTVHGWTFREDRPLWQKIFIKFFSWITIILSTKTIAVSNCDFREAPGIFIKNKITMIHNGVSDEPTPNTAVARKKLLSISKLSVDSKRIYLGTIAELHKNKGLSYAIESFSSLTKEIPHILFFIAGEGEERSSLENLISKLGLEGKVIFLGFVENASALLPAFDIFLLPSIKEGLPYTILEAGKECLPVIATSVGGVPEIIEDMKSGILIKPRHPEEITKAVLFLHNNKEKALGFGQRLSEKIAQEFSLSKMIEKTSELYRN